MIDNQIYLINCTKTLSVHSLLQAHRLGSYLVSTGTTIGWSTVHNLQCRCYSRVFCIAFPELTRWLFYYPFLTFTTSILCNLINTKAMTLLKVDNIRKLCSACILYITYLKPQVPFHMGFRPQYTSHSNHPHSQGST